MEVILALYCRMRKGEILELRFTDFDTGTYVQNGVDLYCTLW